MVRDSLPFDALQDSLGETVTCRCLNVKATVKLFDIAELTTVEDDNATLKTGLDRNSEARVFVTTKNSGGTI